MIKTELIADIENRNIDDVLNKLRDNAKLKDNKISFVDVKYSTCHIGNSTVIHSALLIYDEFAIPKKLEIPNIKESDLTDYCKTFELIKLAANANGIIVTHDDSLDYVKDIAKGMGLNIKDIVSYSTYETMKIENSGPYYLDNIEFYLGNQVACIALCTSDLVSMEDNKNYLVIEGNSIKKKSLDLEIDSMDLNGVNNKRNLTEITTEISDFLDGNFKKFIPIVELLKLQMISIYGDYSTDSENFSIKEILSEQNKFGAKAEYCGSDIDFLLNLEKDWKEFCFTVDGDEMRINQLEMFDLLRYWKFNI